MNNNELRLGNWVRDNIDGINKHVKGIHSGNRLTVGLWDDTSSIDADVCSPISLTYKWFKRFGFSISETSHSTFYLIYLDDEEGTWLMFNSANYYWIGYGTNEEESSVGFEPLNYVHQLQNLYFCLTNKELEYDYK